MEWCLVKHRDFNSRAQVHPSAADNSLTNQEIPGIRGTTELVSASPKELTFGPYPSKFSQGNAT
jgi:hypothetical protein